MAPRKRLLSARQRSNTKRWLKARGKKIMQALGPIVRDMAMNKVETGLNSRGLGQFSPVARAALTGNGLYLAGRGCTSRGRNNVPHGMYKYQGKLYKCGQKYHLGRDTRRIMWKDLKTTRKTRKDKGVKRGPRK